ncbi:hypothetical protein AAHA92_17179 [Salvia divinorum]|uniref:Uncharacterized protein n=1 Tax=Salvia divinorum TaxID=28513 RepID=A0ABD1H132_SALDI
MFWIHVECIDLYGRKTLIFPYRRYEADQVIRMNSVDSSVPAADHKSYFFSSMEFFWGLELALVVLTKVSPFYAF